MRRRDFISIIGVAATTGLFATRARTEPVRRIGVLMGMDVGDPAGQSEVTALKQGLQELGWVEGRNLQIEHYWPGGEPDRIQASAKELVARKSEVIVARTTAVVAALLKETRAIPIVFTYVFDPIGSGFVRNFAQPGGNVTGFQTFEPTIVGNSCAMTLTTSFRHHKANRSLRTATKLNVSNRNCFELLVKMMAASAITGVCDSNLWRT